MKKLIVSVLAVVLLCSLAYGQSWEDQMDMLPVQKPTVAADRSPFVSVPNFNSTVDATWDIQISFDLAAATGANGNAGAECDGTYFYTARWASNLLHKYDLTGTLVEEFSVPGVTGLRDLAFDGTYFYGGAASTTIYVMDFVTKTLVGTISSPVNVRNIAYDPVNDAFWVGDWATDLTLVSRSGSTLATIPSATHGMIAMYGSAYDAYTPGGPYLWVFNQDATAGGMPQNIHQIDLNTLTPTGVVHDVYSDFPQTGATAIAGGLWIEPNVVAGTVSIGGVLQGVPDYFFVYELTPYGDLLDPNPPSNFTASSNQLTPTSIALSWTDPTTYVNGNALTNFTIEISRDGSFLASVPMGSESYTDNGLTQWQEYDYEIWAKDNVDSTSAHVSARMAAGGYPPVMAVDPTAFSDTVLIGAAYSHEFTIYNNQSQPGNLDYTITETPSASWLTVSSYSGSVTPSGSAVLTVDVNTAGLTPGTYSTDLIVAGNDPFNAEDTVHVSVLAAEAPVIGFTPGSMSFTLDPTGVQYPAVDSMAMTITNTGQGPLIFEVGGGAPELMYYKFNEVGATQTQNYANPATAVNAYADVLGGLSMGGTGQTGAALIGTGGSSGTDYVNTNWVVNLGTGSWTISLWLNNLPSNTTLYYLFGDATANSFRCFLGGAAGAGNLLLRGGGLTDVNIPAVAPGPSVVDMIYDANAGEVRAYVNGTLAVTVPQAGPNIVGTTGPFKIGGYSTSVGLSPGSLMDEFKMYTHAIDVSDNNKAGGWLSTNPTSGTVPAGGSMDIQVIADAAGLVGGNYSGEVNLHSNDPVHPDTVMAVNLTVFGTPQIGVDPLTLDFGDLFVGAVSSLPVTISNTGNFPLTVSNIVSSNAVFTVDTTSFEVGIGESQVVNVSFNPLLPTAYSEILTITSDDPVTPTVDVVLSGTGIEAPVVAVSPDTFDVSLVSGATQTETLTISNLGNSPLYFTVTSGLPTDNTSVRKATAKVDEATLSPEVLAAMSRRSSVVTSVNVGDETAPVPAAGFRLPDNIDGEEIFGSIGTTWSGTLRDRGNVFHVTDATTLIENKMYLEFTTATEMYFFVYRGTAVTGTFDKINEVFIPNSGTGQGFYTSGPISVPLEAGYYYYIGASWNGSGTYYRGTAAVPIPCSFGSLETGIPGNIAGGYPPGPTATSTYTNFQPYYCAIVTGTGLNWLSASPDSGSVMPGGSMDVDLTFDSANLLGGDYYADVVVASNDPVNPEVRVGAHMHVTGQTAIYTHPDPVDFGTTFISTTKDMTLWVNNVGTDQLNVTNITSTNPVFTVNTTSFSVDPFDSAEVTVSFSPLVVGSPDGYLIVESNDPAHPADSTVVMGVAVEPPVAIYTPNYSNPVPVQQGDSVDVSINIANAGGSNLEWSAQASLTMITAKARTRPVGPVEQSQYAEYGPVVAGNGHGVVYDAIWDLEFSANLEVVTGALGNAGAEFDGTYYYTSRWASNLLHKIDQSGTLVEEFSIPGVSGLRDLAFDGTYMYGGAASTTVYMMDVVTKTLIGSFGSPVNVRNIAYDSENDAFWVGDWTTDLYLIDRSGTTLATIPAATHGQTSVYGSAYDNWSDGGPYLWLFSQTSGAGFPQLIVQLSLPAGTPTGISHDVTQDFPPDPNAIAGGLFTAEGIVPGKASIGGLQQGTPDMLFAYELTDATPPWFKMMEPVSGVVAPSDNTDLFVRLYGTSARYDTMYVVFMSNDPQAPVVNMPLMRDLITGIGEGDVLPTTYAVSQNYPNPFNPTTTIKYQLPKASDVRLVIYNVLGQKVRTLLDLKKEAGYFNAVWDGRNDAGTQVSSGVYIYRFQAGEFQRTMKLMLLK